MTVSEIATVLYVHTCMYSSVTVKGEQVVDFAFFEILNSFGQIRMLRFCGRNSTSVCGRFRLKFENSFDSEQ